MYLVRFLPDKLISYTRIRIYIEERRRMRIIDGVLTARVYIYYYALDYISSPTN